VKIFISSDIEGTAGIVDWEQCTGSGAAYEIGRALTLAEVNAAIEGAVDAGATDVLVNDSHWTMQNLPPEALAAGAAYLSGRHKPLYMMEGLDGTFGAAMFVGYHGSAGTASVLSHTYNPNAIAEVRLNGRIAGESAVNSLVALHHRVPVALVTGDAVTAAEAEWFAPDADRVVVKESVTRFAARSLHPQEARRQIREGAAAAIRRVAAGRAEPPAVEPPFRLEVDFLTEDMAEMASWIRGVDRAGGRTARIESTDALQAFRSFVAAVYLTRQAQGR